MYKVFLLSWPLSGGKRVFVNGLNNNRRKSKLCVGKSSVVKIYIIRLKPGPVEKNATSRPSDWESNQRPLYY